MRISSINKSGTVSFNLKLHHWPILNELESCKKFKMAELCKINSHFVFLK